jgi:hypothetical protein
VIPALGLDGIRHVGILWRYSMLATSIESSPEVRGDDR